VPAYAVPKEVLEAIVSNCADAHAVVIVDDSSPEPIDDIAGASVVRRATNGGPGAARQTGLEHVDTPLVAFVDTDVVLPNGWLEPLLAHFADEQVALVAPRVSNLPGHSVIDRYEAVRSPLDLGGLPDRVRAGSRVSYVPSAVAVCRVDALGAVGGFDRSMRVGEDVDLTWKLDEAGYRVRYEPSVIVHHRPRPTLGAWLQQRYAYGSSAAPLARRHPGALAPVRVSGWSAAAWIAVAAGWPIIGCLIAASTTVLLARKLRKIPDGPRESLRLAGLGHLYAGRSLASAITRAWWPIAVAAALVSKRCRRAVLLAAVVPPVIDWLGGERTVNLPEYTVLRVLDDVAYGAGVTRGALRERSIDALVPDLTSWPKTRQTTEYKRTLRQPSAR
jgi:mycofactocin system glycosyltransferase